MEQRQDNKPTDLDRLHFLLLRDLCEHQQALFQTADAIHAILVALGKTVPGFNDAYRSTLAAEGGLERSQKASAHLKAMQHTLELMRQSLGIEPVGPAGDSKQDHPR